MTNVIMIPTSAKSSSPLFSIQDLGSQLYCFGQHTYHRVSLLDEMMVLDLGTWVQFNTLKATYLYQSFETKGVVTDYSSKGDTSPSTITFEQDASNMEDCCVIDTTLEETVEVVYFPSSKKVKRSSWRESIIDRSMIDASINEEIEVVLYSPQPISMQNLKSDICSNCELHDSFPEHESVCVECGTDWDPAWSTAYEAWVAETKCPWPQSKTFLSDKALAFLRSVEPPAESLEIFELAYEEAPNLAGSP